MTEDDLLIVRRRNRRTLQIVLGIVAAMIAMAYAASPLYTLFCQATGFGGTPSRADAAPENAGTGRTVTLRLNADVHPGLPWDFHPETPTLPIEIGKRQLTAFIARNRSDSPETGTAVFNVTPPKVGKYFRKIQCFCFGLQTLEPHQETHMPVLFFIDPGFVSDPAMQDVSTVTLSYTFFRAESSELDQALETFYNSKE